LEIGLASEPAWHWGFLEEQQFDWDKWQPRKPTLLIVDYAASSAEQLGSGYNILLFVTTPRQKIRFLLIERSIEGDWWERFLGAGSRREALLSTAYSPDPLKLGKLSDSALWQVFALYAHLGAEHPERDRILSWLKHLDSDARPLFAALAGDAKRRGADIRAWDEKSLLNFQLREADRFWKPYGIREKDKALLAFATFVGGLDTPELLSLDPKLKLPDADSFRADFYEVMTGTPSTEHLVPLEPDILGELFVLEFLKPDWKRGPFGGQPARDFATAVWRHERFARHAFMFVGRAAQDFPKDPILAILVEPSEQNFSRFGEAAFYVYLNHIAHTDTKLARQLFDKSANLYNNGSRSGISWLGRAQTAFNLCVQYLELGSLQEANHESGTDCQRGHGAGLVANHRASDGKNQKEGANEFSDVLLHESTSSTPD
jgi:hypothetical protein